MRFLDHHCDASISLFTPSVRRGNSNWGSGGSHGERPACRRQQGFTILVALLAWLIAVLGCAWLKPSATGHSGEALPMFADPLKWVLIIVRYGGTANARGSGMP